MTTIVEGDYPLAPVLVVGGPHDSTLVLVDPMRSREEQLPGYRLVANPPPTQVTLPYLVLMHDSVTRGEAVWCCFMAKMRATARSSLHDGK